MKLLFLNVFPVCFSISVCLGSTAYAMPDPAPLQGTALIRGEQIPVIFSPASSRSPFFIQVGKETFELTQVGAESYEGLLEEKRGDEVVVRKTISVIREKKSLVDFKRLQSRHQIARELKNSGEFKCPRSANTVLILGDTLQEEKPLKGYCLKLQAARKSR